MNQKTKSYLQLVFILLLWISMVCVAYFQLIYKPEPNIDEVLFKIEMNGIKYNIPGRYTYMQTLELYGSWPSAKKERTKERAPRKSRHSKLAEIFNTPMDFFSKNKAPFFGIPTFLKL